MLKNDKDSTPLHVAALNGHLNVVEKLLEKGAKIDAQNYHHSTLLHFAALSGQSSIVEKLLEKGAKIDAQDNDGNTPLHFAARYGHLSVIEKLLEKGARIDAQDNNSDTPLHFAVRYGYLSVIEKLLKEGAGINIKNSYDYTPLELAERYKRLEVVNFFRKKQQERPVQRKRRHHHACHHIGEQKYLQRKEHSIYLELEGTDHSVKNGNPTIKNDHAISGTSNPSLWINDLFGWVKSFVSGLLGSEGTASLISQVNVPIVNGTLMLLDALVRKVKGQKYVSTVEQSIFTLEAQGYALNIIEEFEKVIEQAAKDSKISMHRLNIDFMEMQKEVTAKIVSGKFCEVSGILKSYIEKGCPGEKAGKLSPKKSDKFMIEFNKGLDLIVNQSMQQILHNRDSIVNNIEKQQGPKSCLNNTSIQGHLTRDKVKLIS